jgi:large subunit ribosomal protein L13
MNTAENIINPNNPKVKNVTLSLSHVGLQKNWIIVDLKDLILGRVSSFIAHRLMGKHRADYTPHVDCGDHIIVINSDAIVLTGKKETDKIYYHHTGYPGGIKSIAVRAVREKKSETLVKKAVERMLGTGPLAYKQLTRLHIYAGAEHPHIAQQPELIDFASLNRKNKKN